MVYIKRTDKTLAERQLVDRCNEAEREADERFRARYQEIFREWRCPNPGCNRSRLQRVEQSLRCRWCCGTWTTAQLRPEPIEQAEPDTPEAKTDRARRYRAAYNKGFAKV